MKSVARIGVGIGGLCGLWTLVMGLTGWYRHPQLLNLFWVVIPIQAGVLVWGLRETAAGQGYTRQVAAGTLGSMLGGVILFFVSLLFTNVLFPRYFEELRALHEGMLRAQGMSDALVRQTLAASAAVQTPFWNAFFGFFGTTVTGLVLSLALAAFLRKR
jgi:uncharacterized membrane protein YeaQ/YmgE (transglycosylase-associated protein family)